MAHCTQEKVLESETVWDSTDLKSARKRCESLMVYSAKCVTGHLWYTSVRERVSVNISYLAEFAYTGEGFFSIFFNMEVNLDNHAKGKKHFFSYFIVFCSTFLLLIYS